MDVTSSEEDTMENTKPKCSIAVGNFDK